MSLLAAAATAITLTIRVYDLHGVSHTERTRALALAADTLAKAGVHAVWVDCSRVNGEAPPPCAAVLQPGEIVLRIQDRTERGPHILGTAIVQDDGPSVIASIYALSIAARSAKSGVPRWIIMGRATAHEIGHLLLGSNSHGPKGLMRAAWDVKVPHASEWEFTAENAAKIRRRYLERNAGLLATNLVDQETSPWGAETTRMATTVMSSARPLAPAASSSAGGTSDR
jgi:hypothetical protein